MFCTRCGAEIQESHKFCPRCGTCIENQDRTECNSESMSSSNDSCDNPEPSFAKTEKQENAAAFTDEVEKQRRSAKNFSTASIAFGILGIITFQVAYGYCFGLIGVILFAIAKFRNRLVIVSPLVVALPLIAMVMGSVVFAYHLSWSGFPDVFFRYFEY